MFKIDRTLAAQVVNTVKDVCGRDVNFINQYGIIFASTDPERVGTFHESAIRQPLQAKRLRSGPMTIFTAHAWASICLFTTIRPSWP